MIVAGTGHRPEKLNGYGMLALDTLTGFAMRELNNLGDVDGVISGMALGWDTALAIAAISLKIPLTCAIPFEGQESRWPDESQVVWRWCVSHAKTVYYASPPGYAAYKMQRRNQWMVDRCDVLLALWDGTAGGTKNCVDYAQTKTKRPLILNVWPQWKEFNAHRVS